jgi:F0F1-type ATP synthase membrane subunit c/vacuolar-type H+-ATPase subunit K
MAQILAIYGLVASVIISGNLYERMALHTGFLQLGAGLAVGLCGLAAGFAIGIVGDAGGEWSYAVSRIMETAKILSSVPGPICPVW